MKVAVVVTIDTETGEYELQFNNLKNPGEAMDYHMMTEALRRVLDDFTHSVEDLDEDFDKQIKKEESH